MKTRSKFERTVYDWMVKQKLSPKYEPYSVKYLAKKRGAVCTHCATGEHVVVNASYTPDFVIERTGAVDIYVETKGRLTSKDRTKIVALLDSSGKINRKNFRLLFQRDNYTTARKTQRYTEWADKNGIKNAVFGTIKKGWFK